MAGEDEYKPEKGIKTQVFDPTLKKGDMLVTGSMQLYAIRATKIRPDGTQHQPFLAREDVGSLWTDSVKLAETWTKLQDVKDAIAAVDWGETAEPPETVEPVKITLFIGKVESC